MQIHPTRPNPFFLRAFSIATLALLIPNPRAFAQAQSEPAQPMPPAAASEPSSSGDKAVVLDPFEVQATPDNSYGELNSNSITAFKTELEKMPVSADVFDQQFLKDTGMTTVEQTIEFFSAGAGIFSQSPDTAASNSQFLDRNGSGSGVSLRGVSAPTLLINGFFPASNNGAGITGNAITSPFDLEKVEIINGPQALLYGISGAGGVINLTTKQARLGTPAFGSVEFQVDQYGHKQGQLDYGMGNDQFAVRVALIDQTYGGYRVFIGGPMHGAYVQIAVHPVKNTVIRLTYDDQVFDRTNSGSGVTVLTGLSTSNDARNGQYLNWLLATNQLGAAAGGAPSGAGAIPGLDWATVASTAGVYSGEYRHHHQVMFSADTTWNSWLSSQLNVGYLWDEDVKFENSTTLYDAPNVAANPTGTFAVALNSGEASELWEPSLQKVARYSLLADNLLFGGKVHSQTILGADTSRHDGAATISQFYVQADSNWNPIINPSVATANGYTILPTQYFAVANGPVQEALWNPGNPRIVVNGVNYVRASTNITNPALISPGNPEGLSGTGSGDFRHATNIQSGFYGANYSSYFDGNLTTLVGLRYGKDYTRSETENSAPAPPSSLSQFSASYTAFDTGINFKILGGLRGYAEATDDYTPSSGNASPNGTYTVGAHGLGEEVGLKETIPQWGISGSLALYHAKSENENLSFTSTIQYDINPSGLNGAYNAGGNVVNVNRDTQGVQLAVTAATGSWRFRLSAADIKATIGNNVNYNQYYNDQFHANPAGDVTYADGTLVYVNPTYNSKGVIAAPASSAPAGYVPLTLALMNNPSSPYYANPAPVNSQIPNSTSVATVLRQVDPTHGAILTGVTGLPISALQIAPNPGSPPPGNIVVTQAGDTVPGFPAYSMNFIAVYTVSQGPFEGVRLGGSTTIGWKTGMYYYYPLGVAVLTDRTMFYEPTETLFNGILGYSHKYRRTTFSTQLNINNIFNHYHVLLLPSSFNGWAGPNNATLDQAPRMWVWSSTISF